MGWPRDAHEGHLQAAWHLARRERGPRRNRRRARESWRGGILAQQRLCRVGRPRLTGPAHGALPGPPKTAVPVGAARIRSAPRVRRDGRRRWQATRPPAPLRSANVASGRARSSGSGRSSRSRWHLSVVRRTKLRRLALVAAQGPTAPREPHPEPGQGHRHVERGRPPGRRTMRPARRSRSAMEAGERPTTSRETEPCMGSRGGERARGQGALNAAPGTGRNRAVVFPSGFAAAWARARPGRGVYFASSPRRGSGRGSPGRPGALRPVVCRALAPGLV